MKPHKIRNSTDGSHWEFLANLCDLYYLQQKTQLEISQKLNLSRVMVSRMLTEAANLGVVEFKINHTSIRMNKLEERLSDEFPEVNFVVIESSPENVNSRIGRQAAAIAEELVSDGATLAISYGRAVYETIKAIPVHQFKDLVVVQMAGVEGAANPEIDGWELVRICAEKLGGRYQYLTASLFSSTKEIHEVLLADEKISEIFNLAKKSDLAIVGLGSMEPEHSSVVRAGHLTFNKLAEAAKAGSVGYISGQHFTIRGEPINDLNSLTMSLNLASLREIPKVIGVAHGASKVLPLVGALNGDFLTSVVTDEVAALGVLDFLSQRNTKRERKTPN
jgi:DNA-binding transcriptional regulator LsrR (DeoR family)